MAEMASSKECSNFLDTFEVLVGIAPDQKRFTVHHGIAIKRSRFFRAARSECWTSETKTTDLPDHNVETFSIYLHCIYRNAMPDYVHPPNIKYNQGVFRRVAADERHLADCQFERMIDLYVLADSLMDPLTANMAIAEIRRIGEVGDEDSQVPGAEVIDRVFRSTREGDGLRNLLADFYIYNSYVEYDGDSSKAFLLLVLKRFQSAKNTEAVSFDKDYMGELQGDSPWTIRQYYQKLEQSPE